MLGFLRVLYGLWLGRWVRVLGWEEFGRSMEERGLGGRRRGWK